MNENKNEINKNNTTEESFENQSPKDIESDSINYNFTNNDAGDDSKEKSTKKYTYKKSIAVGLAGTILCGASFGYFLGVGLNASNSVISGINNAINGSFSFSKINNKNNDTSTTNNSTVSTSASSKQNISKTVSNIENSVVNISIKVTASNMFNQTVDEEGSGSGIIYSQDNDKVYILTNNHVVDSTNSVTISITGKEQINAKLVGKDATSDLAVISVSKSDLKSAGIENITTAKLGDSDKIEVGQTVIAIGNALGQGKTATVGIISAENKVLNIDGVKYNAIQTDAAINPGNSGGALVNTDGEVIGINSAKASQTSVEGTGYAIPINQAKTIAKELMEKGTVDKPYLGISGYSITDDFKKMYNININGVFVGKIESNSPAEKSGLQVSDIITAVDGQTINSIEELSKIISSHKSNDTITLSVIRNGNQKGEVKATLANSNDQF